MVNAIVKIGGKKIPFVQLKIEQTYGDHHYFKLELDHDATGNTFMHEPTEQMDYIGRFVIVDIQHGNDNSNAYIFKGVVTKVSMTGKNGKKGYLVLEGASPTIMLERGRRMDVYSDMNLYNIFNKVIDGVYSDYMKCLNDPTFKNKIDFLMQYNETDWEFLKRISYLYGENLFYSGSEILFGAYEEWEAIKLTYDHEIEDIEFNTRMLPNSSISYQYIAEQDTIIEKQSPSTIDNSNSYLDAMEEYNTALTSDKPAKKLIGAPSYNNTEIAETVKRDKTRTASQTVYITGKSKTYKSTIGRLMTLCMPEGFSTQRELGTYRVIKSTHIIGQNLTYENYFEAVPASLTTMPVAEPKMPVAESVLGKVTSHEDPKGIGRIQVDFAFANQYSRIWMRVMTPSAGVSDNGQKNRGIVFVPEVGDQVMVGFEYGDPNRPYVMGSMFHGSNGQGGSNNNTEKSIITRSGIKIVFNDDAKSLHIEDPSGNTWDMDGNGNIAVNAPKNMTITVGENMDVTVGKNITVNAGENIDVSAGKDINETASGDINQTASGDITENADNKSEMVDKEYNRISIKSDEIAQEVTSFSTKENMTLQSGKTVQLNSAERSNLF
jgi:type VI secretion system secreted protein VgrG